MFAAEYRAFFNGAENFTDTEQADYRDLEADPGHQDRLVESQAQVAGHGVHADRSHGKADHHGDHGFQRRVLLMPINVQNASKYTAKNSGELNDMANSAMRVERKVSNSTPASAPINAELNAAVSASAALPSRAMG